MDPHHFDANPDFYLMRIQIWILFDADADPTFHPDMDLDLNPDPSFQVKARTLEKVLK